MRDLQKASARALLALGLLASIVAQPAFAADELIVDDAAGAVQIKGAWATSTNGTGFVGDAYRFRVAGTGANTVTWPFPGSSAATFDVFARWTSGPNRASNAPFTIQSADAAKSVTV